MSSPATGSLYSVVTFAVLAGAFAYAMNALAGWEIPSENRGQMTIVIAVWLVFGLYAMRVGRHRDQPYPEALRRGLIDIGRAIKGLIFR